MPVKSIVLPQLWHQAIGDPTLANAILDRLVHNAYRMDIQGESMRKVRGLAQNGIIDPSSNPKKEAANK
jgi:DNA replication protein DnaC